MFAEKGKSEIEHRRLHKESTSPKALAWKMKEVDFHKFLQPVGLKDWSLRDSWHGWNGNLRVLPYFWREGGWVTLGKTA